VFSGRSYTCSIVRNEGGEIGTGTSILYLGEVLRDCFFALTSNAVSKTTRLQITISTAVYQAVNQLINPRGTGNVMRSGKTGKEKLGYQICLMK